MSEIRSTWQRRNEIGTRLAVRKIGSLVNESGISAAGERSLPFYWVVGYFLVPFLMMVAQGLLMAAGPVGNLLFILTSVASIVVFLVAWPFSGLIVYWDCKAAERYANLTFSFGKVMALSAAVLGPAAVVIYLIYRAMKFP